MDTAIAFAMFLLGFVPMFLATAIPVIVLWAATKLFPQFGARVERFGERLFGMDPETNDEQQYAGFRIHPSNYTRNISR